MDFANPKINGVIGRSQFKSGNFHRIHFRRLNKESGKPFIIDDRFGFISCPSIERMKRESL